MDAFVFKFYILEQANYFKTELTKENIWVKRPGTGAILAAHFNDLIGKIATRNIKESEHLDFNDFE